MDKLHSGARWLFRLGSYGTIFVAVLVLSVFSMNFLIMIFMESGINRNVFFIPLIIAIIVMFIFGEVYSRLAYNNWKYKFGDHSLKLERGIIWKKYSNIPYERVQNVDVRRGILARMIGFSTVDIQTAGAVYSGRGMPRSEGHIPAVSVKHAEEIRDFLMHKISKKSGGM